MDQVLNLSNEAKRLAALKQLQVLDTDPEKEFDEITNLASVLFSVPMVAISLVDESRQWFKSKIGLTVCETRRDISFCTHAIEQNNCYVVENADNNDLFKNNPLVVSEPRIKFYAGFPIELSTGEKIGTLCILDQQPREFSEKQRDIIKILAKQVATLLNLRLNIKANNESIKLLSKSRETQATIVRQLHVLIDNVPASILAVDIYGKVIFANRNFCDLFKLNRHPKSLVQVNARTLFEEIEQTGVVEKDFSTRKFSISDKESLLKSEIINFLDGRTFERDYVRILKAESDFGHIWLYRDITEKINNEFTIEKQRVQLAESAKLSALGEMAGGVAHEINNPLTVIQGRASHLIELCEKNQIDKSRVMEYSKNINDVVARIVKIVRGLRSFARSGDSDPIQKISVQTVLEDTLIFCNDKIRFLGVELEVEYPPIIPDVFCRPVQISQVILNLISNACDAVQNSDKKWIKIKVINNPESAQISISNSGPNIDDDILPKIFNPFFTTKEPQKGTGMGLSISKRLAEDNGGRLTVDSNQPFICFDLTLPIRDRSESL
jgi:C4-dicarboxylate-specific signal transduction histidine kinase